MAKKKVEQGHEIVKQETIDVDGEKKIKYTFADGSEKVSGM